MAASPDRRRWLREPFEGPGLEQLERFLHCPLQLRIAPRVDFFAVISTSCPWCDTDVLHVPLALQLMKPPRGLVIAPPSRVSAYPISRPGRPGFRADEWSGLCFRNMYGMRSPPEPAIR